MLDLSALNSVTEGLDFSDEIEYNTAYSAEYSADQLIECAEIVFANAVRILQGQGIDDPALTDASNVFIALVRLYVPIFRKDYHDVEGSD